MSEPEWSLPMNRTELIARVEALEALLVDRPWPDCAQSKMIEWYKRIDVALGVSMVTPGIEAVTYAYIIRLPKK